MTRHVLLLGLLASGLLFPAVVRAQGGGPSAAPAGSSRRVFVEGSLLGSVDRRLEFEEDAHRTFDASWTLAAGGSIGVFLTEAWTLRVELEVPRHAGSDIEAYGGLYYRSATAPGIEFRRATVRRDITIVSLVGVQLRSSGRVRPSLLFGGGLSHLLAHQSIEVQDPPGSPWTSVGLVEHRGSGANPWTENNPTLTLGLDVEILMTTTFSLVPRVRASIVMGNTSATILRPGVAARWRF